MKFSYPTTQAPATFSEESKNIFLNVTILIAITQEQPNVKSRGMNQDIKTFFIHLYFRSLSVTLKNVLIQKMLIFIKRKTTLCATRGFHQYIRINPKIIWLTKLYSVQLTFVLHRHTVCEKISAGLWKGDAGCFPTQPTVVHCAVTGSELHEQIDQTSLYKRLSE